MFFAVVAGAAPLYLILGERQSFFLDEWDFLSDRDVGSLSDLLRPHWEHWTTIPVVMYRVVWYFVGLRSYVPYQVMVIALHLIAATLLWIVMRRADVRPYIAAAAGSAFVLFGAGRDNIVWAFQITFVGSLVCGLAHLLLADHDGPVDRRDAWGIGFGLAGLMCSGVGVTMVIVVGIAAFLRRGWRAALFHTVPLGCVYVAWWFFHGRGATSIVADSGSIFRFVSISVENGFARFGQLPGVGIALAVILIVGIGLTMQQKSLAFLRQHASVPAALLVGALLFTLVNAIGRAASHGPETARAGRYVHLFVAMMLPALAVAADAVVERWRVLAPLVVALLLIGIPGNLDSVRLQGADQFALGTARVVELVAALADRKARPPLIASAPGEHR